MFFTYFLFMDEGIKHDHRKKKDVQNLWDEIEKRDSHLHRGHRDEEESLPEESEEEREEE